MSTFGQRIRPHVDRELAAARAAELEGDPTRAFGHLERAHVLGQASTFQHVRVHMLMLRWAVGHRNAREALGQLLRIIGAATKTAMGLVPPGNTGGANIGPLRRLPVAADLAALIAHAKARR